MNKKILITVLLTFIFFINNFSLAYTPKEFNLWIKNFKKTAVNNGISKKTVDSAMRSAKFLPKVIEYDRYQPEFYEDTYTYIKKRANNEKVKKGLFLYRKEKDLINKIEKNFSVEKELLLALMGIETNFGKYLGKISFYTH